ncbi:ferredoxin reductase [Alloalcanivorax xenomutans]|jgi:stearoyl-CoA 9-desaturase NADPH oxidoreductase|uniref:Ferredoxin reductase n=1 Tax=Alloalcanivorax xenomutans TaxID=1094342 RepID=A0A9Q3W8B5_9GAMM|nr:ferredoxin reductase [Alloalcanivorax xenomutans]ERS13713.1 hypothetical protein Q668_14400 [Alcanivorax sp. PN-3]MBA4722868.1 ferredoxin reductase [Alcanivorax sp.]ARB45163.1 hypothetical protein P40_06760 [Alloalcanivorax xenomutans]MCE7510909.1 ferredoxin reductase [Alloalcanivorax xenomutans]PHS64165.1 MAG: ferredoxin reductase [Alcanivorax sp.]
MQTIIEPRRGWFGRLGQALTSPFQPEDYLALINPVASAREIRARVTGVHRETGRAVSLTLRPNRLWPGFQAGQHVMLGIDVNGARQWRCFSLSSAPQSGTLTVTVKCHRAGGVTEHLLERARPGDVVTLSEPAGEFLLPARIPDRLLFLTAGSGITPVHSIARYLENTSFDGQVEWLHFDRRYEDVILLESLRELGRHSQLNARVVLGHQAPLPGDEQGRFDAALLAALVPDAADRQVYACGPAGFLDAVSEWHRAEGRAPLLHERFQPLTKNAGNGGQIRFSGSDLTTEAGGGESLLEAAERSGLNPAHGCRMGICHTCRCPVRGSVRDLQTGESRTVDNQLVRLCIHAAEGDVEVAL